LSVGAGGSPRVSVVVPAYNVAPFIEQCLSSVLTQSFSDLELIVVDDGSSDSTLAVVEAVDDPRVQTVRKENGGCASARNAGAAQARGEFLAFLDGDDYWLPNMLSTGVALLQEHPEVDVLFFLSRAVDESGRNLGLLRPSSRRSYSFEDLIVENPVGNGSASIVRRRALEQAGTFDESLAASSDCDMWLRIAVLRPGNFACLPEILVCYRRRDGQTTGNWPRMTLAYEQVLQKARVADPEAVRRLEPRSRCHWHRYHAYIAYESGELGTALRFLLLSARASWHTFLFDLRSWLIASAVLSKWVLPERAHGCLARRAGALRELLFQRRRRRDQRTT
jgi:hypothetical protein